MELYSYGEALLLYSNWIPIEKTCSLLYKSKFELLSTNSTRDYTKVWTRDYTNMGLQGINDSCPLWSPIGALFSRSSHSPCFVLLVMKVCVESRKFVKLMMFHLVKTCPFEPLHLILSILLTLISWQSIVDDVVACLSICIHDSELIVIICDINQG